MRWRSGDVIVRREIAWGKPWLGVPQFVVEDTDELFAAFTPTGAPFGFPPGPWPTKTGHHPWHGKKAWKGHGVLHLMRPGDAHAVWVFWQGSDRRFAGWYINFQEPFRRTAIGYDTQDLELDIIIAPDGSWRCKDLESIPDRVAEGRFTEAQAIAIRDDGERFSADLSAGLLWWDPAWASWCPDPAWKIPSLPEGWETADPTVSAAE